MKGESIELELELELLDLDLDLGVAGKKSRKLANAHAPATRASHRDEFRPARPGRSSSAN
jgi:hypothetical protein